jgi:hypothetical protein
LTFLPLVQAELDPTMTLRELDLSIQGTPSSYAPFVQRQGTAASSSASTSASVAGGAASDATVNGAVTHTDSAEAAAFLAQMASSPRPETS